MVEIFLGSSPHLLHCTSYPPIHSECRGVSGRKTSVKCSLNLPSKVLSKHVLFGLAASLIFMSPANQSVAADLSSHQQNICQLASASDNAVNSPFENDSGENLMMMRGMSAKNFDPVRYSGRWFEVASLKRGFAGQGQEDCHCTQGVYTFDKEAPAIQVDTFCVHGSPNGYITGIRGRVQCLSLEDMKKNESQLEMQEMIREKCYLRFPTSPSTHSASIKPSPTPSTTPRLTCRHHHHRRSPMQMPNLVFRYRRLRSGINSTLRPTLCFKFEVLLL